MPLSFAEINKYLLVSFITIKCVPHFLPELIIIINKIWIADWGRVSCGSGKPDLQEIVTHKMNDTFTKCVKKAF